jgi:hypothetical protein
MHLDDAIEQLVILGYRDPLDIARKIIDLHGEDWVNKELGTLAEDIISNLARHKLGNIRRSAEVALSPGDYIAENRMKIAKFWVPGFGYKQVAELTAGDLRAKADWYSAFRRAAHRREIWCLETASLIEAEGVVTIGELQAPLPALVDDDDGALALAM